MKTLSLLLHSVKYLKIDQIIQQLKWRIKKPINLQVKSNSKTYHPVVSNLFPSQKNISSTTLNTQPYSFSFLNKTVSFQEDINWIDLSQEKLWLYNLHYFDYIIPLCQNPNQENFETTKKIIVDWIENNPTGHSDGWEPYPLSLRIVNWIFFYSAFQEYFKKEKDFESRFLESLFQQANYLTHFIEYHIQANHLFTNFKALVFAGIFFNNQKWLNKFVPKLTKQIEEQILLDGGHYERSPMYQNIIVADFIDLVNIIKSFNITVPDNVKSLKDLIDNKLEKMITWQNTVLQPDGKIPLLGDSAFQIALNSKEVHQYYYQVTGKELKNEEQTMVSSLNHSGYHIFRSGEQYLIFDTGELGVSYQPGHAHCDILSFEYSYKKQRFFVDSGVGNYLESDLRLKARSIYAHNTAVINGIDQAQLWKAFRMAKRVTKVSSKVGETWVEGEYQNSIVKKKKYKHARKIKLIDEKFFLIQDDIFSANLGSVEFLFHIAPEAKIELKKNHAKITIDNECIVLVWRANLIIELKDWFYTPEFGKVIPSKMLSLQPEELKCDSYLFIISPIEHFEQANQYFEDRLN